MHKRDVYLQGPDIEQANKILEGVCETVTIPTNEFLAAVAYATVGGCQILCGQLKSSELWVRSRKRWLISIDFGRTEPDALAYLKDLPNSSVRIPNGNAVLQNKLLIPPSVFHSKTYIAASEPSPTPQAFALFVGSANLTLSGLTIGNECGVLESWCSPLDRGEVTAIRKTIRRLASALARSDPPSLVKNDPPGRKVN